MQAIRIPMFITPEDRERAAVVAESEKQARSRPRTPEFIRQGLGACAKAENADDFTEDGRRGRAPYEARARAAAKCRVCPFSDECLPWAIGSEQSGVFGGVWLRKGKEVE